VGATAKSAMRAAYRDGGGMRENIQLVPLDEVDDSAVLNSVEAYIRRFVAYPSEHASVAHTLWIAHAHLMDCWETTPRIFFGSPERGSGKTRALEITEPLVSNPVHAVNVTPAYLFRKVGDDEGGRPTILYDEVDTLFGSKVQDTGEVRGLLNASHRRGAVARRCVMVGKKVQTEELPAYCAVALAGIGALPDTIASRAILINMRRRAPDEPVEPFRRRLHFPEGRIICDRLARWCESIAPFMDASRPEMPKGVEDRSADCWEPLLAIADAAGGSWPGRARTAARALVAGAVEQTRTTGVQLLSDLYNIFGAADKLATTIILERLHNLPESSWKDVRGKVLDDRGLATRLNKYGVKPKKLRTGDATPRGYEAADLQDAWKRYVLSGPPQGAEQGEHPEQGSKPGTQNAPENRQKLRNVPFVPSVPVSGDMGSDVADFEERAAILEYDGGLTRPEAEARAWGMPDLPGFLDRRVAQGGNSKC
jgi:hypothetical protein